MRLILLIKDLAMQIIEDLHLAGLRRQAHLPAALVILPARVIPGTGTLILLQTAPVVVFAVHLDVWQSLGDTAADVLPILLCNIIHTAEPRGFGVRALLLGATVGNTFLHEVAVGDRRALVRGG